MKKQTENIENDVIFTPVYKGEKYKYHECSNCQYHVTMQESVLTPLYFGETLKFCPWCGKPIIRFSNIPNFIEEPNWTMFQHIEQLDKIYSDLLDYYCRVILSQKEFDILRNKCKFAVEFRKNGGIAVISPGIEKVAKMDRKPWNHWNIKKLKERVENMTGFKRKMAGDTE